MNNIKHHKIAIITILCCFFTSCSLLSICYKEKTPTNGLVAYYPFNNNAIDNSMNNNEGNVKGAKLTNDRKGNKNSAYIFNGISDYIYIPNSKNLQITEAITISVWIKTDYALPYAGIICKAEPYEPRHGYLIDINDDNKVRADIINDHSANIGSTLISNNTLTDNKWHHILTTYDGKLFKLYIDGKLNSEMIYNKGMQINTEPLLIGWDESTWLSHRHFKGSIDDIRIYNRELNNKEIAILYKE